MVKKSKYKLFSYLIENHLIYYKSIRENSKLIAFAILEYLDYNSIESIINDLLRKRVIQYYSIQIEPNDKHKKILLVNFEESKKERIIKAFNIVQQSLLETDEITKFLKEKALEKAFLATFYQKINSNTSINKNSESIIVTSEKSSTVLNFYTIDLDLIENTHTFISSFLNLATNFRKKILLIFNFKIDNSEMIKISSYFVWQSDNVNKSPDLENRVNNFFRCNLIKRQNTKIKMLFHFFWRLGINDIFFFLNDFYELFNSNSSHISPSLLEINQLFEKNLSINHIEYVRLSKNLLFIEQDNVLLILQNLKCEYIHKIVEKYYSKYFVYILILNDLEYKELLEMETIKLVKNINVINPQEIHKFNYKEFKKKLKNS